MGHFHARGGRRGQDRHARVFLGRAQLAEILKRRSTVIRHFLSFAIRFLAIGMIAPALARLLMASIGLRPQSLLVARAACFRAVNLPMVAMAANIE
jgi:hypothetical protein